MDENTTILIVDDQPANLDILRKTLESHDYIVLSAPNGEIALKLVSRALPDLILLDIVMPGIDGFEVCRLLKDDVQTQDIPVIFVTAKEETASVVEGFRIGGVDYITKPFVSEEVLVRVQNHLKVSRLTRELTVERDHLEQVNAQLRQEIAQRKQAEQKRDEAEKAFQSVSEELTLISEQEAERWGIQGLVGQSASIAEIMEKVRQLHTIGATSVLIMGESGTGKELIARAIHFGGKRSKGRFIPINCSAIPGELVEATLFGHVRGAFTGAIQDRKGHFERASGGTLFLDEICDMSLDVQAKLLRVLEDGTFIPVGAAKERHADVGILAATNANLQARIQAGEFREDLYFRLARFIISVPPLRARREDISVLTNHFLKMLSQEMGRENAVLSSEALEALMDYHFPGNVRELKNIIEHALILSRGGAIGPEHLYLLDVSKPFTQANESLSSAEQLVLERAQTMDDENILMYIRARGSINNTQCRELLGVDKRRATHLLQKMLKYGVLVQEGKQRWSQYRLRR